MTTKRKLGQCQVEGCLNTAKYSLYRTFPTYPGGRKEWLRVCPLHEREIGDENMRRVGGRYEEVR